MQKKDPAMGAIEKEDTENRNDGVHELMQSSRFDFKLGRCKYTFWCFFLIGLMKNPN